MLLAVCLLLGTTSVARAQFCPGGTDEECDDSEFCNGQESCTGGLCFSGSPPDCSGDDGQCTVGVCNEATDACEPEAANEGGSCNDGEFCTVGDVCSGGTCAGPTPRDCSGLDGVCTVGVCDEGDDACEAQPANEGGSCNDGEFCTVGDVCSGGTCAGPTPRDCSGLDGVCTVGVCDEGDDACEAQPANEGGSCNDGEFCTVGDVCSGGTCAGPTPRDCSVFDSTCTTGVCNEAENECQAQASNEGGSCNDGQFCTVGDVCAGGTCTGPTPRDCSALDGACTTGVCDEGANACEAQPANQGASCNDGQFCTVGDVCNNGMCAAPSLRDCSVFTSACTTGVCDEGTDACEAQPANQGEVCNDGQFCTVGDACNNGSCTGSTPRDCSAFTSTCTTGVCDEGADTCEAQAANQGGACNDGQFCTVGDVCNDGTCAGATPRDCSVFTSACTTGVCNEGADACQAQAANPGATCDDGQFCTVGDACNSGTCTGSTPRDCSALNGVCTTGVCNEGADACQVQAANQGGACDDGQFCTVGDACNSGTCTGPTPRDCSVFTSACTTGVCNETADACQAQAANQGGVCDDGQFCTVGDVCNDGTCAGPTSRDCSVFTSTCTTGVCNEGADACQAQAANQGGVCDDGQFCTVGDACNSGTCAGPTPLDCSALTGACTTGVCDEGADACQAQPVNQGGTCDDALFCTVGDVCTDGTCAGATARDCSVFTSACTTGVCDETADACQPQNANQGGTCDDTQFCTVGDACNNGMCVGPPPRDCSAFTSACTTGVCNEGVAACQAQAANEGGSCANANFCDGVETCVGGACTSPGDPCLGQPQCQNVCDEVANNCLAPNGLVCNDGQFCTATDACDGAGACVGAGDTCAGGAECAASCNEAADNCFAATTIPCTDDGSICSDDLCTGAGACGHPPNTAPCDDGLFCNGTDVCSAGACTHAGDPCLGGAECVNTCDETADNCITPVDTPCSDDGLECTTDLCLAGACAHAPVDARCDQGECVLGVCTPGAEGADKRGCVAASVAESEQCTDDGFSCTEDTCTGGACLHVPIASRCVPPDDCTSAVCEPGQPTADVEGCIPGPALEEGQGCAEDGEPCTNDICRTGTCAHDDVPDTITCEPVTRAFRQALALESLAKRLMASVGEAFAPNTTGPAVVTQGNMVAHLAPVASALEQASRTLSGKAPLPPSDGRARGVPKTLAQLRADAAIQQLKKRPADVRAFLRLVGTAKRKRQVQRESGRKLRSDGRLVLERMRKLNKELRRLRRVSQTFVP